MVEIEEEHTKMGEKGGKNRVGVMWKGSKL